MEARTDDFHSPRARSAAAKAVVNSVLSLGTSFLSLLSGLLAAALILYSGYVLYDSFYTQQNARSGWDLLQYKPVILEDEPTPLSGENRLAVINADYRAWLTLYGTNIDYPVMQGGDDLYYANHDIYKQTSLTGAIYLAAGNSGGVTDSYNLIYGHHMDNGAMFGGLDDFRSEGYFYGHREGILVSKNAVYDLYAFAVADTDAYQNRIYAVGNRMNDVLAFLRANVTGAPETDEMWSADTRVPIFDGGAVAGATKIVALSTCANATTNGRLVVFYTATRRNLITVATGDTVTWVYDGTSHTSLDDISFSTNYPGDSENPTTIEYSLDGGRTWHNWEEGNPPIINVSDSTDLLVRVTNDVYGRAVSDPIHIQVTPRPVTVAADGGHKTYGRGDPAFSATVTNVVGNDTIEYTVTRPGAGTDEAAGTYRDAIVPSGEEVQGNGNYTVTYVPADFTIERAPIMHLFTRGYDGEYDGNPHEVLARTNVPDNTIIEYSTDGGNTWSTEVPYIQDVGEIEVMVRATNPQYEPATATVTLRIKPKRVIVRANPASKMYNGVDPQTFTATVTGLVGNDTIEYTVTRPGAGRDEEVGVYWNAIVSAGDPEQGNYAVTYLPANFTVTPSDRLILDVTGWEGTYDGNEHSPAVSINVPDDTVIEYSTDGGATWHRWTDEDYPSITNVGELTVLVRASNPNYDTVTETVTLKVDPASVTVTVHDGGKIYGQDDPESYEATVTGLVGDDTIEFTISRPDADQQQSAGLYPDAIVAEGDEEQGNYIVTYVPADFEIAPATDLTVKVEGFDGVYDGDPHSPLVEISTGSPEDDENTVVEYSIDGGETWTQEPPSLTDAGTLTVLVRVTNPDYVTTEVEVELNIRPRQVIVTVGNYSKLSDADDPEYKATVEGLLDGDEIEYTIVREEGEDPNHYAITPTGEERQGNYVVVYQSGELWVINNKEKAVPTATPGTETTPGGTIDIPDPEDIEDDEPPLAKVIKLFNPRGTGRPVWALLNLICLIITIYLFIPLLHLGAKFGRARLMKKINRCKRQLRVLKELAEEEERDKTRLEQLVFEARKKIAEVRTNAILASGEIKEDEFNDAVDTLYYQVKQFLRRFRFGILLELIFAALALVVFILTEDMRLPMVIIDRWTPVMIILMLIVWLLDVRFIRYQGKVLADEEEAERRRLAREQAAMSAAHK